MTFLTVFSAPKPFTNPHIDTIQRNAIQSWQHLGPDVEAYLVGHEDGMAEVAVEYGVPLLADVKRNESGTPLVRSIFDLAAPGQREPLSGVTSMVTSCYCQISWRDPPDRS